MVAATNRKELVSVTETEFAKLTSLIDSISVDEANTKHEDDTSIKDIIGHRAHWISLFLRRHKDGMAGKEVFLPAKGYKWSDLKKYNKQLRAKQSAQDWKDVTALLHKNHRKLLKFIDNHSETELYANPMKGAKNNWTAGRWAEAAGPSHYRSASKYIRACLKA